MNLNALFLNVYIDARLLKVRILEKLQNRLIHIYLQFFYRVFKGTVGIVSSDPPFIEGHTRFTTAPFKPLSGY